MAKVAEVVVSPMMGVQAIMQEPGVVDLSGKQRMLFAMALKQERAGNPESAKEYLDKAVNL